MDKKIITMRDITQELNVSIATVNRALTGKGRISEETRAKVFKTAKEMGYMPNYLAKALSSKDELKIGIISPMDLYFKDVVEGVNSFHKTLSHYNVKLLFKHYQVYDVSKQLNHIEECLDEKVDGVLISAAHPLLLNNAIDKLSEHKIPTITFNNDAPDSNRICYVGQNSKVAGLMAGELMSKFLRPSARVALMTTLCAGEGLKERATHFIKAIERSNKNINVIGPFEYYDNSKSAKQMAREIMRSGNIDGIYANNMEGTRALGRAAKELGIKDELILIGHDSNTEIDKYIEEGIIDASLFQDPFSQGYYSLKLLFEYIYLKREVTEKTFFTKSYILMMSNIHEKGRWNESYYKRPDISPNT